MMKKYLIVDDDADDKAMFCEALMEVAVGDECYSAPNGRRALMALAEREIELPDLIFLDINMPMMNGWQLLALLKEKKEYKNIPVIMYSTSSCSEDVERAQRSGALCFFSKPASYKELKENLALVVKHMNTDSLPLIVHSSPLFLTSLA